jgi:hypothetical protein
LHYVIRRLLPEKAACCFVTAFCYGVLLFFFYKRIIAAENSLHYDSIYPVFGQVYPRRTFTGTLAGERDAPDKG